MDEERVMQALEGLNEAVRVCREAGVELGVMEMGRGYMRKGSG